MNQTEATTILRLVRTTWPEIPLTDETIKVWTWALDDLPYADVESALKVHMRSSPFAPKPADLRKTVAEAVADTVPWEDAWTEVTGAVKKYGWVLFADGHKTYRESLRWPGWSTPEVEAAVKVIVRRFISREPNMDEGLSIEWVLDAAQDFVNGEARRCPGTKRPPSARSRTSIGRPGATSNRPATPGSWRSCSPRHRTRDGRRCWRSAKRSWRNRARC
jgi:hypothetical protein